MVYCGAGQIRRIEVGIYDREEITHIVDEGLEYIIIDPYYITVPKWGRLFNAEYFYRDSMTEEEKKWVREFLSKLRKKFKFNGHGSKNISRRSYFKCIKEFIAEGENE